MHTSKSFRNISTQDFENLYLVKELVKGLGHMLLLKINRKAYVGSLMVCLHFTLVTLKDQCQGHS